MKKTKKGLQPTVATGFLALLLLSIGLMFFPPTLSWSRGGGGGSGGGKNGGGGEPPLIMKKIKIEIGKYVEWQYVGGVDPYGNDAMNSLYIYGTIPRHTFSNKYTDMNFEFVPTTGLQPMDCNKSSMLIIVDANTWYLKGNVVSYNMAIQYAGKSVEVEVPANKPYKISAQLMYKQMYTPGGSNYCHCTYDPPPQCHYMRPNFQRTNLTVPADYYPDVITLNPVGTGGVGCGQNDCKSIDK